MSSDYTSEDAVATVRPLGDMVHIRIGDDRLGTNTALEPSDAMEFAAAVIRAARQAAARDKP